MCKYHNRLFIFTLLINIIFLSSYVKGRPPDRKKTFGFYDDDNNDDYDLHFDQRQNGTENIRISLDGGIIATPYEEPELEPVRLLLEEWGREMMAVLYANKRNFESRNTYKVFPENEKYDMTKNFNSKDDNTNTKNPSNENELKDKNKQSIKIEILNSDSDSDSDSGSDLNHKISEKSEQQNKIIKLKEDENETDFNRNLNQNPEVNNIEFNNFKLPSELISQKNYGSDKRNRSKYRFLNLLRLFRPNSNYE